EGCAVVLRHTAAGIVEEAEVVHGAAEAGVGGLGVPVDGGFGIGRCAPAVFEHEADDVHGGVVVGVGGFFEEVEQGGGVFGFSANVGGDSAEHSGGSRFAQAGGEDEAAEGFGLIGGNFVAFEEFEAA